MSHEVLRRGFLDQFPPQREIRLRRARDHADICAAANRPHPSAPLQRQRPQAGARISHVLRPQQRKRAVRLGQAVKSRLSEPPLDWAYGNSVTSREGCLLVPSLVRGEGASACSANLEGVVPVRTTVVAQTN